MCTFLPFLFLNLCSIRLQALRLAYSYTPPLRVSAKRLLATLAVLSQTKNCHTMSATTLPIVVDVDGFQHGDEPFLPNSLAVACDRVEGSYSSTFDTSTSVSRPAANLSTNRYQTEPVHGLSLTSKALPQDLFPNVLTYVLYRILLECSASNSPSTVRPINIVLFVKALNKLSVLLDVVLQCP